ncbi:site-specific integrase [Rhizobium sp. VS19-DR104.2]|uniref:tyrosine-type recombinase/integrase n=1 Tax=unclassified Rhizobium TaxID=2613769 RepID=UPI001C5B4BEA|nr:MULTISPECIES: tyrosine-type recombinase/integrase [unclassified Rhizobium]MBZ5763269.1 site-specific integrase [Rhizobium sp. VS19-DR96]MBZ5769374.1 site-specific integrase [Rhizobium sp. VS19-DR129.2]MBZ5776920.1 site-specific integrase [Rhizobium sp. VS19-DRK62.2]MBZ5787860.1 site-specific integrase [Rhizobium sp. VS19-DR121]MBZ5805327.1 site-specific integrase [Rhizobium sp. VS19-DR181]
MLKVLFPKSCHYQYSRFGAELELFARWLLAVGYLPGAAARRHVRRLKRILEATAALECGQFIREAELEEALALVPGALRDASTERAYRRFLEAERRLEETKPKGPLEHLLLRYREYLRDVRGLAPATSGQHLATIEVFLSLSAGPAQDLSALTSEHVENFIHTLSRRVLRQTLQHKVAHLRAFLRFCGDRGETARGLERIDTPRTYRGELPPRALGWEVIEKLLASVAGTDYLGRRDHAILHLMAYYGLRPSEIAALTLDAVNWKGRTLRVEQRKTRSTLVLPLADQTLEILDRYLAEGRPCGTVTDVLFPKARSPVGALTSWGICDIFTKRARQSGLPLDGVSSYALRHSFAMRLLGRGVGVKTIGDLLGHHSLESTCVYLRIETDMLRTVALPVPGTAAH